MCGAASGTSELVYVPSLLRVGGRWPAHRIVRPTSSSVVRSVCGCSEAGRRAVASWCWSAGVGRRHGRWRSRGGTRAPRVVRGRRFLPEPYRSLDVPLLDPMSLQEALAEKRLLRYKSLGVVARRGLEGDQPAGPVAEGPAEVLAQSASSPAGGVLGCDRRDPLRRTRHEVEVRESHRPTHRDGSRRTSTRSPLAGCLHVAAMSRACGRGRRRRSGSGGRTRARGSPAARWCRRRTTPPVPGCGRP